MSAPKGRIVMHADDVGMCHGANAAFVELSRLGTCSSGSVMVPCPWFLEVAEAVGDDQRFDLGVHLTLNSEKRHYKWSPISSPPESAGLTDHHGYFWPDVPSVQRNAAPEAVEVELRMQIDAALAAGIDVTHLDDHMGVVMTPEFCDIYVRIGIDYDLPVLLTPSLATYGPIHNLGDVDDTRYRECVGKAREAGFLIFDRVLETPWDRTAPVGDVYRDMLASVGTDDCYFALHPNAPGEIEVIEPDSSHFRTDEYDLFRDGGFRDWLTLQPFDVIGMRTLRDEFRARRSDDADASRTNGRT